MLFRATCLNHGGESLQTVGTDIFVPERHCQSTDGICKTATYLHVFSLIIISLFFHLLWSVAPLCLSCSMVASTMTLKAVCIFPRGLTQSAL